MLDLGTYTLSHPHLVSPFGDKREIKTKARFVFFSISVRGFMFIAMGILMALMCHTSRHWVMIQSKGTGTKTHMDAIYWN